MVKNFAANTSKGDCMDDSLVDLIYHLSCKWGLR